MRMRFDGGKIRLDDELVEAEWKPTWKKVKSTLKKGVERRRVESYKMKSDKATRCMETRNENATCG